MHASNQGKVNKARSDNDNLREKLPEQDNKKAESNKANLIQIVSKLYEGCF